MKKIEIEWIDSHGAVGENWYTKEEIDLLLPDGIPLMKSIGYIYKETDTFITIIQTDGSTIYGAPMMIPKISILHRQDMGGDS